MNSIRNIARLNEAELSKVTPSNASWHTDYRDTAYVHFGGLPFELSEGDVLVIFSQYGNPKHINLMRDKETGKSRGFGWLKYEDQRSTDLAVDNLSGASVLGRTLSVDHARYTLKEGERETVGEEEVDEGVGSRKRRKGESESEDGSEGEGEREMIREELELAKLVREHDDDDPMKAYMIEQKKVEVEEALRAVAVSKPTEKKGRESGRKEHKHRHRHRSRRESDGAEGGEERNGHHSRRHHEDDQADRDSKSRSTLPTRDREPRKRRSTDDASWSDSGDRQKQANHKRKVKREDSSDISSRSRERPKRR
ncbi:RNA-binding protein Cwf29 [Extremus antarcticus]|uniref:RNA-binding protein Cwf29 n=1 Tax=Extremus antarcticus TaxID=702011 RepID=A0AAJ0D7A7_9PEZI|nr:RNA-binding protein Cwf29 [Extremus antarcticus]